LVAARLPHRARRLVSVAGAGRGGCGWGVV